MGRSDPGIADCGRQDAALRYERHSALMFIAGLLCPYEQSLR